MSNILATASARLFGQPDVPLDLSWNKGHSCERFVTSEDLRPETFLAQSEGDISAISSVSSSDEEVIKSSSPQHSFIRSWHIPPSNPSSSITPPLFTSCHEISATDKTDDNYSSDIRNKSETKIEDEASQRSSLPFSIDAILGNDSSGSCDADDRESERAQVYSSYMAAISSSVYRQFAYASSYGFYQQPMTSTPSKSANPETADKSKQLFWCHKCNVFCSDKSDAERHYQIHSYRGDTCSLKRLLFREHGYVTAHEQTGYLDRIECGLCKKVVANCFFMKHMCLHDGHICDVCDHEFSTNSKLQDHMYIHLGLASFSCKLCDRKFSKRSSLTQHQRYHREYKSYSCRFCSKSFNSKYTCTVHERIHTGENPFRCEKPGCNKGFPQKIQLRLHMATHKKRGEL